MKFLIISFWTIFILFSLVKSAEIDWNSELHNEFNVVLSPTPSKKRCVIPVEFHESFVIYSPDYTLSPDPEEQDTATENELFNFDNYDIYSNLPSTEIRLTEPVVTADSNVAALFDTESLLPNEVYVSIHELSIELLSVLPPKSRVSSNTYTFICHKKQFTLDSIEKIRNLSKK